MAFSRGLRKLNSVVICGECLTKTTDQVPVWSEMPTGEHALQLVHSIVY